MDTDAALTQRLARDIDAGFPALVTEHSDRLYSIALRLLGDRRDAEEVAQDALVRAYRAMHGYPRERVAALKLRPWLASIASRAMFIFCLVWQNPVRNSSRVTCRKRTK